MQFKERLNEIAFGQWEGKTPDVSVKQNQGDVKPLPVHSGLRGEIIKCEEMEYGFRWKKRTCGNFER